jgi:DNA repair protein RecN (Recombination protein N)
MLREIHVQNYALIDSLTVEFGPGLNLLSGETGSGKSILVDALSLAMGGRASPDLIRTGQDRAVITAVFASQGQAPWGRWLEERGLAEGEPEELMVRREIQTSGKTRALVNDQPVTVAALRELGSLLVEVHGQNEQVMLYEKEAQLELLDQFAEAEEQRDKVRAFFARRRDLEKSLAALNQNEQERLRAIDLRKFQMRELEQAKLEAGEDSRLQEERNILANLEKIRGAAETAYAQLYENEGSAVARLATATRALEELGRYDAASSAHREPLLAAKAAAEDAAFFLRDYLENLEANPRRLEEVEDRLALIDRLKRKYGATVEEILAYLERSRQELSHLENADERRGGLEKEVKAAQAEYLGAARKLSLQRREVVGRLEKLVRQELAQLGMEKTLFRVEFAAEDEARAGAEGLDEIRFLISPNPGEELRALEKIASGGELSRLMLALKTITATAGRGDRTARGRRTARTLIFDEVDAGIGGRVAECVGQRLRKLSRDAQVLCVTHLAQIACFADQHFIVEKLERQGRTVTRVNILDGERARAQELARMLSGSQITDAVLKHATLMLKQAAG